MTPSMPTSPLHSLRAALLLALASVTASIAAAATATAASAPANPADVHAVVDAAIRPLMARHDIPGMSVGVLVDGQPHVFHYGQADREHAVPVGDDTLFEVGSVSKTFTATLAAYAEATGRLSLDDHPSRFVPALKGRPIDRATLRQLGTYTPGGLPLQFPETVADGDDAVIAWLRDWHASAAPGTRREYSNPSLGLFGLATARALHDDFAHAMEATLFPAFGLSHTFIHVPERARAQYAWGYRGAKPAHVNPGPFGIETYGVKTTAADLLRFVQAQVEPSALPAPMRRAVEATHVGLYRAGPLVQGLGWEQYPWPLSREWLLGGNSAEMILDPQPAQALGPGQASTGPRLFDKTGSTGGFGAYVLFVPSARFGLVLLANRNYPIPDRVEAAWDIVKRLVPGVDGD